MIFFMNSEILESTKTRFCIIGECFKCLQISTLVDLTIQICRTSSVHICARPWVLEKLVKTKKVDKIKFCPFVSNEKVESFYLSLIFLNNNLNLLCVKSFLSFVCFLFFYDSHHPIGESWPLFTQFWKKKYINKPKNFIFQCIQSDRPFL